MEFFIFKDLDDILVMVMVIDDKVFGNWLFSLCKQYGWLQLELGEQIGIFGVIIGCYE